MPSPTAALPMAAPGLTARERFFLASIFAEATTITQAPDRLAVSAWLGHIPFAFWLAKILQPEKIVELGVHYGTSFCAFCQQAAQNPLHCSCYAVDSWQGDSQAGFYGNEVHAEVAAFTHAHYPGNAHLIRAMFDDALPLFDDGSIDLLHIDGFHTREAMLHDFEAWLPKMAPRGVIVMHDINARLPGYSGFEAWNEIRARFAHFQFEHGYGLGVVLAGATPPRELVELASLGPEAARLTRNYFAHAGASLERFWRERQASQKAEKQWQDKEKAWLEARQAQAQAAGELEARIKAQQERIRHLELAIQDQDGKLEQALADGESAKAAHAAHAAREHALNERLHAMQRRIDAYENSNSWKLTAPLRKLRHLFK